MMNYKDIAAMEVTTLTNDQKVETLQQLKAIEYEITEFQGAYVWNPENSKMAKYLSRVKEVKTIKIGNIEITFISGLKQSEKNTYYSGEIFINGKKSNLQKLRTIMTVLSSTIND